MKRIICFMLAASCVFFTGCNSILFSGNLHFKSYEPETVPWVYDDIEEEMDDTQVEYDMARFDVEGTDAFFILPDHESDPEKIIDFKVLDYTDAGTFIYAYRTLYYGDDDIFGLGSTPQIGRVTGGSIRSATTEMLGDRSLAEDPLELDPDRVRDPDASGSFETLPAPEIPEAETEAGDSVLISEEVESEEESLNEPPAIGEPEPGDAESEPGDVEWDLGEPPVIGEPDQDDWWQETPPAGYGSAEPDGGVSLAATGGAGASATLRGQISTFPLLARDGEYLDGEGYLGEPPVNSGEYAEDDDEYLGEPYLGEPPVIGGDEIQTVLVLMAYNPANHVYKVFYSSVNTEIVEVSVNDQASDEVGTLSSNMVESPVLANRLVKSEQYFLFDQNVGYLYDREGGLIFQNDYSGVIASAANGLKNDASERLQDSGVSREQAEEAVNQATVSVTDAVMDGYYYAYLSVTVELPEQEGTDSSLGEIGDEDDGSDDMDEEDAAIDQTIFTTVVACYDIGIGGETPGAAFVSDQTNWEQQKQAWQSVPNGQVYEDLDAVEDAMREYSMDRIKAGQVLNAADTFSVFHTTEESGLDMEIVYAADIYNFAAQVFDGSGNYTGTNFNLKVGTLAKANRLDTSYHSWIYTTGGRTWQKLGLWDNIHNIAGGADRFSSALYSQAVSTLLLLIEGDYDMMANWNGSLAGQGCHVQLADMQPGGWDSRGRTNANPLTESFETADGNLEAMYAHMESEILTEDGIRRVQRYIPINVPNRACRGRRFTYWMKPVEWSEKISRTFYYYEETEEINSEGKKVKKKFLNSITESVEGYPTRYQMIFPGGTSVTFSSSTITGEMVAPSGDTGAIYYAEVENDGGGFMGAYASGSAESRIRYSDGSTNLLQDEEIPGQIMDAGALYYKDRSGREAEMIAAITDEGVKLYIRKDQSLSWSYWDEQFLTAEEFTASSTKYGLVTDGDSASGSSVTIGAAQEAVIEDRLQRAGGLDSYSMDNISLLNQNELLIASLSNGLFMVNFRNGVSIQLQPGAFFAAFEYGDVASRQYMVVGFNTDEYYYKPTDLAKAKCYSMDLEAQNAELEMKALELYLDNLAAGYLNRAHRVTWVGDETTGHYEIVTDRSDAEREDDASAEKLFFSSTGEMEQELYRLTQEMGFFYTVRIRDYAAGLREKFLLQREKLKEFYDLCGLGTVDGLPSDAALRMQEGYLISAKYTSTLEDYLVTLRLSDEAISRMPSDRQQYREYQAQMKAASMMNEREADASVAARETSAYEESAVDQLQDFYADRRDDQSPQIQEAWEKYMVELSADFSSDKDMTAIRNTSAYQAVLTDQQEAYEDRQYEQYGEIRVDWDTYLQDLLNGISPDNVVNQSQRAFDQFCQMIGADTIAADKEQLWEEISEIRRIGRLEELIVEYRLKLAAYQSTPYREQFKEFQNRSFETEAEREQAFKEAPFYRVIEDLIDANAELLGDTDWETELGRVLSACGGAVLYTTDVGK